MTTVTIFLPESLKAFADSQIPRKGYGDIGRYLSVLLGEAQAREEEARLEALLLEGLASPSLPLDNAFRERLNAKVEQIIERHKEAAGS